MVQLIDNWFGASPNRKSTQSEKPELPEGVLPLVRFDDPVLTTKTSRFNFQNPETDPTELAHTLARSMLHHGGLGLAAPQLGLSYRAFVIRSSPVLCCFNPIIVDKTDEMTYDEEGCLSFPGVILNKKRHNSIRVRYAQPNGEVVTKTFTNMTARVFQHELDHLDGITFGQSESRIVLEMAVKKAKKRGFSIPVSSMIRKG